MSKRKHVRFPQQPRLNQAPISTEETQPEQDARLKRVMEDVQKALTKHRAIVAVNNILITDDGKFQPQVSIRLLK